MGISVKSLLNHLRERQTTLGVNAFYFRRVLGSNNAVEEAKYPQNAQDVIEAGADAKSWPVDIILDEVPKPKQERQTPAPPKSVKPKPVVHTEEVSEQLPQHQGDGTMNTEWNNGFAANLNGTAWPYSITPHPYPPGQLPYTYQHYQPFPSHSARIGDWPIGQGQTENGKYHPAPPYAFHFPQQQYMGHWTDTAPRFDPSGSTSSEQPIRRQDQFPLDPSLVPPGIPPFAPPDLFRTPAPSGTAASSSGYHPVPKIEIGAPTWSPSTASPTKSTGKSRSPAKRRKTAAAEMTPSRSGRARKPTQKLLESQNDFLC